MGTDERDYVHEKSSFGSRMTLGASPLTPVVSGILMANVAIFLLSALIPPLKDVLYKWFSVFPVSLGYSLQLWRLLSYQFLHSGLAHVFFNMLVLFFFGPILERLWGGRKFLVFYLTCGTAGGLLYTVLVLLGLPYVGFGALVGASGAIYGILAAIALLFPKMRVFLFGIFPIQMMYLAILLIVVSLLNVQTGANVGGEMAHLSGMVAGAVWVFWEPQISETLARWQYKKQRNKFTAQDKLEAEVNRILDKIHKSGIESLSSKEKKVLDKVSKTKS